MAEASNCFFSLQHKKENKVPKPVKELYRQFKRVTNLFSKSYL